MPTGPDLQFSPYKHFGLNEAHDALVGAIEATHRTLTPDEYTRARVHPMARKFWVDHGTLGGTYMHRHAQRARREGNRAQAVAMECAVPPLIAAGAFANILGIVTCPLGPYLILAPMYDVGGRSIRSEDGTREDVVCHRLQDAHYAAWQMSSDITPERVQLNPAFAAEIGSFCAKARQLIDRATRSDGVPELDSPDVQRWAKRTRRRVDSLQKGLDRHRAR